MKNFFELIEFYGLASEFVDEPDTDLAIVLNLSSPQISVLMHEVKILNSIIQILNEQPECDISLIQRETSLDNYSLSYYLVAVEILFPCKLKIKNVLQSQRINSLLKLKKKNAIHYCADKNIAASNIAEKLNVDIEEIKTTLSLVPVIVQEHAIVENLKKEMIVREFFSLHPYSVIKESAKLLQIPAQTLRTIIEKLRIAGEDIKANDIPVAVERELLDAQVIRLKIDHPSLTTTEISLKLGISPQHVKQSINNMVRVWQVEKAENYEFHFTKTSNSLDEIKNEAWSQHNGTSRPSSRWMEMILSATEKQMILHGLKAPEKLDIRQDIRLTKHERDNVIDAAIAADSIDIDYNNIQITGTHD